MTDNRSALQIRRDVIAQPTPGPWTFRRAITFTDGGFDYGIDAIVKGKKRYIAEAFEVVGNGVKVDALANARLIAAAPELLAALDELVAKNYGQPRGVTVPALDRARAALARANS